MDSKRILDQIEDEWSELGDNFKQLEATNEVYLKKLNELTNYQQSCAKMIGHQRYRMKAIEGYLKNLKKDPKVPKSKLEQVRNNLLKREAELQNIEQTLPKETGKYLKVVLGNINVSFLNKEEKFRYKDDYEKFKLVLNCIAFILASLNLYFTSRRLEIVLLFLLVWYYCTVSIRESILKANGSRIKGWWRLHHVLSTVTAGILLVWPENQAWNTFRNQFFYYTIYVSFIQYLQFKYQRGALYRLKALGQRDNMDITIEGFHSWMWRGLTFLLPFLFIGYVFQLYHAVVLLNLGYYTRGSTWHVRVLGILFFIFFVGNTVTTFMVVPNKIRQKMWVQYRYLTKKKD